MMTTTDRRAASVARQRRAEADAAVERAARVVQHRADYLASFDDGPRGVDHELRRAVARDRAATAHADYLRARIEQADTYGGSTAGAGAALALAEHTAGERVAARTALAELIGADSWDELDAALTRRGLAL